MHVSLETHIAIKLQQQCQEIRLIKLIVNLCKFVEYDMRIIEIWIVYKGSIEHIFFNLHLFDLFLQTVR